MTDTIFFQHIDFLSRITLFIYLFLLAIRKNTIYKLMWWLYKARYYTVYYYVVVGCSSSDVTSGAL